MNIPTATYRIQFNSAFDFIAGQDIVHYLNSLGISHIYASPIFKARKGSMHGYDVVDPNLINPELGGEDALKELIHDLRQHNMGWIQDIVPNHMAYDSENHMLMDVIENGPISKYANYFDIQWDYPYEKVRGKVLVPLLGKFYGECLESGEIKLTFGSSGLAANYYQLSLPLRIESYAKFFTHHLERLRESMGKSNPDFIKYLGVIYSIKNLPDKESLNSRYDQIRFIKELLWEIYKESTEIKNFIDNNLEAFNGKVGKPESFNLLEDLLSDQFFRLAFWKVGTEEINYRRFFTVNELISLQMENEEVFKNTHSLIFRLVKENYFDGLRIDHIDGLFDPTNYLRQLREKLSDAHVIVEKILELNEEFPSFWPIEGTTGYDFLNHINGLFCKRENEIEFDKIYYRFINERKSLQALTHEKKRLIIGKHLAGDVDNLAHLLARISERHRYGSDFTLYGLRRALVELLSWFPVYRTYISEEHLREQDVNYVKEASEKAKQIMPDFSRELGFITTLLLLKFEENISEEERNLWMQFVQRFQQVTGPLMAKGFEDTVLYIYHRLISLNEVGGNPGKFGISSIEFHFYNKSKVTHWPHTMNTTSTHDTKRGEDVRARLNVLSEIPIEWEGKVKLWSRINRKKKSKIDGMLYPDKNDEYFFYQTLVGTYPFEDAGDSYKSRIKEYILKSIREAKVYTAWLQPDSEYENAFHDFIEGVLNNSSDSIFMNEFIPFQKKIANYGIYNSLSQTLVKLTAPGIPDFYQGTELWDLSMVDPDNRRPVDFEKRNHYLNEIKEKEQGNILDLLEELLSSMENGKIKLYLIHRMLQIRNSFSELFNQGNYHSLEINGKYKDHIIAFCRNFESQWSLTVAPRFLTDIVEEGRNPFGNEIWEDTQIGIPANIMTWHNPITDQEIAGKKELLVGEILQYFPVGFLTGEANND